MFAAKNLQRHCFKSLSSLLHHCPSKSVLVSRGVSPEIISSSVARVGEARENDGLLFSSSAKLRPFSTWRRSMSSSSPRGRSMRSKVEKRMQKETGKTMREVRRAKKIQKKLMTENERLVYNLKRAKRKVAVLLQKLKKYELPELPPPKHDPEILTPEQLQAYKKIGFKNKNYVTVGVRGVFGGVVQNLHMHWKFHETVQVCCDNFPKEKIKEMAMMIARLSGGIVVNIHNVKTIIMYRGRNYRQPKNLIPINTLTKRKALFKARFEQALESQKLNIKKFEQQLRRSGINPEDPIATASIQRVAASFFNAIDKKDGTPYVFREDKLSVMEPSTNYEPLEPTDEREQAELDKFIADIEDAAEREWAAEEAAEKEDMGRIRYWNREDFSERFRRSETSRDDRSSDDIRRSRDRRLRAYDSEDADNDEMQSRNDEDSSDSADSDEGEKFPVPRRGNQNRENSGGFRNNTGYPRNPNTNFRKSVVEEESETFHNLDKAMWQSDDDEEEEEEEEEHDSSSASRPTDRNYMSESEEEGSHEPRIPTANIRNRTRGSANFANSSRATRAESESEYFDSGDSCSDSESDWLDEDERYQVRKGSETVRARARRGSDGTSNSD